MATLEPVVPILNNSSKDILSEQEAVLWQLVRFSLENPGDTSGMFEDELISFRKLHAEYANDREGLAEAFATALRAGISQYYPNSGISVSVDTESRTEISYALQILIASPDGKPLLTFTPVIVDREGNSIDIDYTRIGR